MKVRFFLLGIKNIIFNPEKAWETIDSENKPAGFIRDSFLLPLIVLVSVSTFAGSLLFTNTELSPVYSLFIGIRSFFVLLCTVYVTALILGEITFPLDLGKDFYVSFTVITFSFVPFLLCQIFSGLFESLLFVNVISLYGLYIFWEGAEKFLDPPQYKKMPLLIATSIMVVCVYVATNAVLKMLMDSIYYAFFD